MNPPHRGPHTVSPIVYDTVPNFGKEALPRRYAFVVDEAGGTADMAPCPGGVRTGSYMLDITNETKPFPVSVWQVPVGNFCTKGGRFGPHQSAETVNGRINRFENKIAWLAYFNAGIRVLDLSDPYQMKELGYYIPKTNERSHPIAMGQPTADSNQRRRYRRARARLRVGSSRNGVVHPRIQEAELNSSSD